MQQPNDPLRGLRSALGGGLLAGEVGLIRGQAGVGKTSLLVLLSIERALKGEDVLHISVFGGESRLVPRSAAQHVRDQYDSILEGTLRGLKPGERADAVLSIERHRLIHIAQGSFSKESLVRLVKTLADAVVFEPKLVVIDGWEPMPGESLSMDGIAIWCASRQDTTSVPADHVDVLLEVQPERAAAQLYPRKIRSATDLAPIRLDTRIHAGASLGSPAPALPTPQTSTLFSGGAVGAEATFGQLAEKWGIRETNFTFDGHVQAHTRGAQPLTEAELAQGDVSLAYVARRLRRPLSDKPVLRRVLQSLWHQVSRSEQIFVIGTIQEDGTVTGGTGWSVELARMWGKRLWVYDQEKESWFRWNGDDWVAGLPTIDAITFCGTGTRQITENAVREVEALFARSFTEPHT